MKKALLKSTAFLAVCIFLTYFELLPGINRESLSKYYGLDYVGIFFVIIAQALLKNKDKNSFIFYTIGLISNGIFGYIAGSGIVILFSLYSITFCLQNWAQWKKDEKQNSTPSG